MYRNGENMLEKEDHENEYSLSSPPGCSPKWVGSPASFSCHIPSISSISLVTPSIFHQITTDKAHVFLPSWQVVTFHPAKWLWQIWVKEIGAEAVQRCFSLFCSFFLRAANHPLAGQYVPRQCWLWRRKSCQCCHFSKRIFRLKIKDTYRLLISKCLYASSAAMCDGIGKACQQRGLPVPNSAIDSSWHGSQ